MRLLVKIFKMLGTVVLTVFMYSSFSLFGQVSIEDSTDYFAKGLKAYESEDYHNALKFYNKYLKMFPNDAPAYNNRGNVFIEMGEEDKGMQDYLKALSIDSSIQLIRYNIGNVKFDKGLFGESVEYFKQELDVNPSYSSAYNNLGYAYYMLEEFDLAINSYKRSLSLDTNHTLAQNNLENARKEKAQKEKWEDKMAKYNMIVYDSSFNQLKELGFPSSHNINFVASPHYIYDNWDTYSGFALKLYESNKKLIHVINLKDGVENGYAVDFNSYRDLDRISYTSQAEKYKIEISYGLKFNAEKRKFELSYTPSLARITKIHDNKYIYVDISYKKQKLKIEESYGLKKTSLFPKRVKDTTELLAFLKSKDYLSSALIEQFLFMGGITREGKSQEEVVSFAGFKPVFNKLLEPFKIITLF